MFRIGHYTGKVYEVDKVALKDIHECCSLVQEDLTAMAGRLDEMAATLHRGCNNCLGCEEAKKA